ncbi:MAG: hypothetical protein LV481_14195 [Methylacidiphilales bacterium]|nr:hypothetical protein [Candidatus Methylacidiphilales bacterium]
MPLSWNEIRSRAIAFSREWTTRPLPAKGAERAEAQTFWNEFFEVFGKKRRHVAAFEALVKNLEGNYSRIDLLWPGTLLAEHKSPGENLSKAEAQGMTYISALQDGGRDNEAPRYLIVSDFNKIALHDLEPENDPKLPLLKRLPPTLEFTLQDLQKNVHAFGFMAGYRTYRVKEEDPANIEAAELLAKLHDVLEDGGYPKKDLDRFLVRILFCLFAEDTGIFTPKAFEEYLDNHTAEDGSDLGLRLDKLFRVLDAPPERRQATLDEELAELPYVNGRLFEERLEFADFNRDMRNQLLACTRFNWSRISPAIFGSLFQAIMEPKERRQIGAHYTSERDILKVIHSLFLDDLDAEFAQIKADRSNRRQGRLEDFQQKLAAIHLLDPACGCGNFLILAYRELRTLEIAILLELHPGGQQEFTLDEINRMAKVDVDQLYGIEIGEWPARIAEVAIWLMDHLMNQELSSAFGQLYQRLPLKKSAKIVCENALHIDWNTVLTAKECTYILGNPPFVGKHYQNVEQRADMVKVFGDFKNTGDLDYVTCWFIKAAKYIQSTKIRGAFVSTNSITQGEQVPILWGLLFGEYRLKIHFAHRTFSWMSEARGKAHVHVVIIGFGTFDLPEKHIIDYEADPAHPTTISTSNISPYLTPGSDTFVTKRQSPLCNVPEMRCGNKPSDGGNFILTDKEKKELVTLEPEAKKFLRRFTGSEEFINGNMRWCLWLVDASPGDLRALPLVMNRVKAVKEFRERSSATPTQKAAATPSRFFYESQPAGQFIAIPEVSSMRRPYIPIGLLSGNVIVSNKIYLVAEPSLWLLGNLSSHMHMAWVRVISGRLKSDFQYSGSVVYNNYPWPQEATDAQKTKVEECAQVVLDARQPFLDAGQTLADLYDPLTMPANLLKAHQALDRAVDRCYRKEPFENDRQRVEFLFALYQKLTAPLIPASKPIRRRRN